MPRTVNNILKVELFIWVLASWQNANYHELLSINRETLEGSCLMRMSSCISKDIDIWYSKSLWTHPSVFSDHTPLRSP